MNQFQQFDISDFLNEIQEPLFLMDQDEILFFNRHFEHHYQPIAEDWRSYFLSHTVLKELDRFFKDGLIPGSPVIQSLFLKNESEELLEWNFIPLPSSYNIRFLIAKGRPVKKAEVATHHSQDTLSDELRYMQSILSNSHDLIAILDKDGNYKFISDSVAEKLGFPASNIVGRNYKEFASEGRLEVVRGDFFDVLKYPDEVAIDFWVRLPSGKRIFLQSFAKNLLHHPQIQGIIFSSRDVTEHIQTEKSLQRRFEIENLINQISSRLINGNFRELESEFLAALSRFGEFLKATQAGIFVFNSETEELEALTFWIPGKEKSIRQMPGKEDLTLIFENQHFLEKGKVRLVTKSLFAEMDGKSGLIQALVLVPMISANRFLGFVCFEIEGFELPFEEKEIQVLRQLGDIFAGAFLGSQMTRKLERNENLLATTELLANSGSWRFTSFKKRFHFSGGLAHLFGLGDQPKSLDFSTLIFKIDKPFRTSFIQNLKASGSDLRRTSGEFTLTDSQGKITFISYEIEGKKDFLTQGLEIYGFCTDISHKRASEKYLKLQSQILAQVSDPILVTNLDLEVIYINEAAVQLSDPEAAVGFVGLLSDLVTFHWEEGENLAGIAGDLYLGEVWKAERYIQTRYTHYSPFEISIQAIHSDSREKIGYSIILRGLEEKYKSEQLARRAQLIVENSPAVLFRVDPNDGYRIQYISENINRFGYDAAYLIQNQISFLDILHPEDAKDVVRQSIVNSSESGIHSFSGEYRIKTATGSYIWVEDKTNDVSAESGIIIAHEGLFQDVSDRKNLELIQSQRDKQYRILASNIPGTNIFLMDAERRYILAEGSNFDKWGLTKEDFEGKTLKELQHTPLKEASEVLDRVYHDLEIVETEFEFKGRHYHRTIRPIIENDRVEFVLSIIRDIQEEYQAKLDLQQSEEKYRRLVEESTEIIFSLTETFLLYYVSPNVKQFLGYDSQEVIGRSIFDFLNPDDLGVFQEMLGESNDFLAENQYLEFRLRHKSGDYRVFNSNGKLIEDKSGIHRYYTGVARDISKLKEAQRELLLAKDKAEQASLVKSQFLSVMSHEIRTPMNAVIGLAHFLMEEDPRPDQLENLKTLQFSAENLMALINDILDYNKIDSGKVELERLPFDLRNIVHRIVHSHSFQAGEKSLKISCEIDERIPETLIGDWLRLGQIINNLVSNAIKFTEKGFVRISLSKEFADENITEVRFTIEDSGIGIPENKRKSIFEAFTQASSSTSRKFGGTGLGLAIVKRLIELQGSDIEVRERKGGGSVFEFTLPFGFVDFQAMEAEKADLLKSQRSLENASILVAEDNTVNQILIRKFLTKWNAGNLIIASDGLEALEKFHTGHFDLVLLDLQMPGLDGFEVAREIRSHADPEKSTVPILALTAASFNEVKEDLKINQIDDFVPKPFTPETLYEKILKHLNSKNRL